MKVIRDGGGGGNIVDVRMSAVETTVIVMTAARSQ